MSGSLRHSLGGSALGRALIAPYGVGLVAALAVVGPRVRSPDSQDIQALVAAWIDGRFLGAVIGTGPLRIRIGSGFRSDLLLAR